MIENILLQGGIKMKVLENKNDKQIMWMQIHDIIALNERHITLPSIDI